MIMQILNEEVYKHSTHIEDVIYDGPKSVMKAVEVLDDIKLQFNGDDRSVSIQTKTDGAPSIIWIKIGTDFGISTKAIFNKEPICCWSLDDIDEYFGSKSPDLVHKLQVAYEYLQNITPDNSVYQGDLLFTRDTLENDNIDGVDYICWQPNTILYAVEKDSDLGRRIENCELGIAVHTRYIWDGENLQSLELKDFDVHSDEFSYSSKVFLIDTYQTDFSSIVNLDSSEKTEYMNKENYVKDNVNKVDYDIIYMYKQVFDQYHNYIIKQDLSGDYIEELENFIYLKRFDRKFPGIIEDIESNKENIELFYRVYLSIRSMKNILIKHLNDMQDSKCFVKKRTSTGMIELVPTNPEGFVITNGEMAGKKLVDRYEFSALNFSKDVVKGFEH